MFSHIHLGVVEIKRSRGGGANITGGCHSSRGAILPSSLDAMLESQKAGAEGLLSLRGLKE